MSKDQGIRQFNDLIGCVRLWAMSIILLGVTNAVLGLVGHNSYDQLIPVLCSLFPGMGHPR